MTEQLNNKTQEIVSGLLNANADVIAKELASNPEGKLNVSVGVKLRLVGHKLYVEGALTYSRKFTDELEGMIEVPDPSQPKLPLLETVKQVGATFSIKHEGKTIFSTDKTK